MKKLLCILISATLLISVMCMSVSAITLAEYSEYSGSAISSTNSNLLEGYAFNLLNDSSNNYNYWVAVRVGQYEYLLCLFNSLDDYTCDTRLSVSGACYLYDERMYSYVDGINTRYQAGFEYADTTATVTLSRGYIIGNVPETIGVNTSDQTALNMKYVKYLLYSVLIFLLLWVAFQFLNKRWLLP